MKKPNEDAGTQAEAKLSRAAAATILACEGFGSLSAEVLALRKMVPYVGSTVYATSILLAIFLAALAGGYERGGRLARAGRADRSMVAGRLSFAALWCSLWLSDAGPALVFDGLPGMPTLLRISLYAVLAAAPVAWTLGETVLLVNTLAPRRPRGAEGTDRKRQRSDRQRGSDATAGTSFGISTAGNVAGALGTSLILLAWLGVGPAVAATICALGAGAVAAAPKFWPYGTLGTACLLGAAGVYIDGAVYVARTAYADYRIEEGIDPRTGRRMRTLNLNASGASRDDAEGIGWPYIEHIENELCEAGRSPVLALGAGGRTIGRGRECAGVADIRFIDVDGEQERIDAELRYGEPAGPLEEADARRYLRDAGGRRWPAIVADAYSHGHSIAPHLATTEWWELVRRRMTPDGYLWVNLIRTGGKDRFDATFERTLRGVFSHCTEQIIAMNGGIPSIADAERPHKTVFRCRRGELDGDRAIYSDARPRVLLERTRARTPEGR